MIQESEVITLLLGVGGLIFISANRRRLRFLPSPGILLAGFYVLLTGWVLNILEGFFLQHLLNVLEHACYAGRAVLVTVWCWKAFAKKEAGDAPHRCP